MTKPQMIKCNAIIHAASLGAAGVGADTLLGQHCYNTDSAGDDNITRESI